jgi:hypothetical protein
MPISSTFNMNRESSNLINNEQRKRLFCDDFSNTFSLTGTTTAT